METIPASCEVVILGGGPAGLSTLNELAFGLDRAKCNGKHVCCLIDANTQASGGSKLPKGQYISGRTMELWERWDQCLPERIAKQRRLPKDVSMHIISKDPVTGQIMSALQDTPSKGLCKFPGFRVQQPLYEGELRKTTSKVCEQSGGALSAHYGCIATKIVRKNNCWQVTLEPSSKSINHYSEDSIDSQNVDTNHLDTTNEPVKAASKTIRAKYLVGCDGGKSLVRKTLEIRMQGPGALAITLTVLFKSAGMLSALRDHFAGAPHGLMYTFKKPGQPAVGIALLEGTDTFYSAVFYSAKSDLPLWAQQASGKSSPQFLQMALEQVASLCELGAETWSESSPFEAFIWQPYSLCSPQWSRDNAFLVGDAAKLLSPTGGMGMNSAVEDAVNLGWKLALKLNGCMDLLRTYEHERKLAFARYNEFNVAALRDTKNKGQRSGQGYEKVVFGPGLTQPILGGRAPFDAQLYESLNSRGFTLVLLNLSDSDTTKDVSQRATSKVSLQAALAGHLETIQIIAQPELRGRCSYYRKCENEVIVIRPDRHICWLGSRDDLAAILGTGKTDELFTLGRSH